MKKSLLVMVSMFLVVMLLAGCTSKPEADAAESAKIFYDLYIKGDIAGATKLGMNENEASTLLETTKETLITLFKGYMETTGLVISDEQVTQIVEARIEGIKKLSATAEIVSEDKESAEVKLSTTYFDELSMQEKVVEDVIAELENSGITNEQEMLDKMAELFVNKLIEAYKNLEPSKDQKSETIQFILEDNVWIAENMAKFGTTVGQLTSGQ